MKLFSSFVVVSIILFSINVFAGKRIDLPPVPAKVSGWNCGVISGYRLMLYQMKKMGTESASLSYSEVENSSPKSIDYTVHQLVKEMSEIFPPLKVATAFKKKEITAAPPIQVTPGPNGLIEHLNKYVQKTGRLFIAEQPKNLDRIIQLIDQDEPLLALIDTGKDVHPLWEVLLPLISIHMKMVNELSLVKSRHLLFSAKELPDTLQTPRVHYVVVNGYDIRKSDSVPMISFIDANNVEQSLPYQEFENLWNITKKDQFISKILEADGIQERMIVYAH